MKKRMLSWLLAALFCLRLCPVGAFASEIAPEQVALAEMMQEPNPWGGVEDVSSVTDVAAGSTPAPQNPREPAEPVEPNAAQSPQPDPPAPETGDDRVELYAGNAAAVEIGSETAYYREFTEAWEAATATSDPATIRLLDDVTLPAGEFLTVDQNEVTLVGGDYSITGSYPQGESEFTLILVMGTGHFILESGTLKLENEDGYPCTISCVSYTESGSPAVTIRGGAVVSSDTAIEARYGVVTVEGGEITGGDGAIYAGDSTVAIKGGKITADGWESAISAEYGTVTIEDGIITGTNRGAFSAHNASVRIICGTFTGAGNETFYLCDCTAEIEGGLFCNTEDGAAISVESGILGDLLAEGCAFHSKDSQTPTADAWENSELYGSFYVDKCTAHRGTFWDLGTGSHADRCDYCHTIDESTAQTHTPGPDGKCTVCGGNSAAVVTVAIDGESPVNYSDAAAAFRAVQGKTATLTFLTNLTSEEAVALNVSDPASNITVEADGVTITGYYFYVTDGSLTVQSGNWKSGSATTASAYGGTLNITGSAELYSDGYFCVYGINRNTSINISGNAVLNGKTDCVECRDSCTVNISGDVSLTGGEGCCVYNSGGAVTISGGTFVNNSATYGTLWGTWNTVLTGGSFKNENNFGNAISTTSSVGTIKTLLGNGCRYVDENGNALSAEDLSKTSYKGPVTVKECEHSYDSDAVWEDQGNGKHGKICSICNSVGAEEPHAYDADGTCVCGAAIRVGLTIDDGATSENCSSLREAWDKAQAAAQASAPAKVSAEIVVLQNLTIPETEIYTLSEDNCEITLSVTDGKTLTVPNTFKNDYVFCVEEGKLTWADGKLATANHSGNTRVRGLFCNEGGELEIRGGEVDVDIVKDDIASVVRTDAGTTTISGGTLKSTHMIVRASGGETTITGNAALECSACAAWVLGSGKLTISGSARLSGAGYYGAVCVYGGDLIVEDSPTLEGSYGILGFAGSNDAITGSITINGDGVRIDSSQTGIDLGDNFASTCSISGYVRITSSSGAGIQVENGTLKISDGVSVKGTTNGLSVTQNVKAELSGGIFTGGTASVITDGASVNDLLANGCAYYDGTGTMIDGTDVKQITGLVVVGTGDIVFDGFAAKLGGTDIDVSEPSVRAQYGVPLELEAQAHSKSGRTLKYEWHDDGNVLSGGQVCLYPTDQKQGVGEDNARYIYCVISDTEGKSSVTTDLLYVVVGPRVVTAAVAGTKTYDGTTDVPLTTGGVIDPDKTRFEPVSAIAGVPLPQGDDVTVTAAQAQYTGKNAAEQVPMTASGLTLSGTEAQYYTLESDTATGFGRIDKAPLSISRAKAKEKSYNGTADAEVDADSIEWVGLVDGEEPVFGTDYTIEAAFADVNAGQDKEVLVKLLPKTGILDNYACQTQYSFQASIAKAEFDLHPLATPDAVVHGGKVLVTLEGLPSYVAEQAELTCMQSGVEITAGETRNTWNVTIPETEGDFVFRAALPAHRNYTANPGECTVHASYTKLTPHLTLTAEPGALVGGGTVRLRLEGLPPGETAEVTCKSSGGTLLPVQWDEQNGVYSVVFPNRTESYTFHAVFAGSEAYEPDEATCTVTVTEGEGPQTLELTADRSELTGGGTVTLTAQGVPEHVEAVLTCTDPAVTPTETGENTWRVTLPNETKTYTFTLTAGNETAACLVRVTRTGNPVQPTALTLTADRVSFLGGGSVVLTAQGVPEGATAVLTCSDTAIVPAVVSANSWRATLPDETKSYTFTVTAGNETAVCTVTVTKTGDPVPPAAITLTADRVSLFGGGAVVLTAQGVPAGVAAILTCSDSAILPSELGANTWRVTLPNATKTYSFILTAGNATAACTVTVTQTGDPAQPTALTLTADRSPLSGGGTVVLTAQGVPEGAVATVTCSDASLQLSAIGANTWRVTLPNESKSYTFTLTAGEESASCTVTVVRREEGNEPGGPVIGGEPSEEVQEEPVRTSGGASGLSSKRLSTTTQTQPGQPGQQSTPATPATPGSAPDEPAAQFTDVASTQWYYNAVNTVVKANLMSGTGRGFEPDRLLTRGMLAQILYQHAGTPAAAAGTRFTDVSESEWYANAVNWAAGASIVSGYSDGRFGANDSITREQLAVMLWRYAGAPAPSATDLRFADAAEASEYAVEALCWAVENGILSGKTGNRLDPKGAASRAEAAQMLANYLSLT